METVRKPLQGITNIIRFNWHFYVLALVLLILVFLVKGLFPHSIQIVLLLLAASAALGIIISLLISWYVYDHTDLYSLDWLNKADIHRGQHLVNINAGFDETSAIIAGKYPGSELLVFDFYDPTKHTEISIERARKAYPAYPGTITVNTESLPLRENSVDHVFLVFAAHEIRDEAERIRFFQQLRQVLKPGGSIIVTEHLRDINNFIAYTIGFFHFFSMKSWKRVFSGAKLKVGSSFKITPFVSVFILTKHGDPA